MGIVLGEATAKALEERFHGLGRHEEILRQAYLGYGLVLGTLLTPDGGKCSVPQESITLVENQGVVGDCHACAVAEVDGRDDVLRLFLGLPKGTPKANLRQVTVVSHEEGRLVAQHMGLPGGIMPSGLQAENLILEGIPQLSKLPPRTRLMFLSPTGEARTASLYITAPNASCGHPHANIVAHFKAEGVRPAVSYIDAAANRRGLTAVVETGGLEPGVGGLIYPGDVVTVWKQN